MRKLTILLVAGLCLGPSLGAQRPTPQQSRERWNRVFTADEPSFNTEPNDFLVRMAARLEPGAALDLGMGQGRNAIYLAQQGWRVTGVDVADEGLRIARERAAELDLRLETVMQSAFDFDFGEERWDLVAIIYFGARGLVEKLTEGLRPGGVVVVEGFHKDATKNARIGPGVVWETNELLGLFEGAGLRILQYEDVTAIADYGLRETRVVRLAAQKVP